MICFLFCFYKRGPILYFKPTRPTPNNMDALLVLYTLFVVKMIFIKYEEMKYLVAQKINYHHHHSPPPLPISNSINSNFKFDIC